MSTGESGLRGTPVSLTNDRNEKISPNYFRKRYCTAFLICAICILKLCGGLLHLALSVVARALKTSKFSNLESDFNSLHADLSNPIGDIIVFLLTLALLLFLRLMCKY